MENNWRGLLYIIIGALIFSGIFSSIDFYWSFWNRAFIFFLVIIVGCAIVNVAQEENKK